MSLTIVSAQVQEMASIRAHLYDIEKLHQRIKAEYIHGQNATNGSDKTRKFLDCGARRPSWRGNNLPAPRIEHRPPPLVLDLGCCSLSLRPLSAMANRSLAASLITINT
jgi:hypothetical protein